MRFKRLECIVLKNEFPEFGLKAGDLGTVVEVYKGNGLEVEFVKACGETQAVISLDEKDVRSVGPEDLLAVRPLRKEKAKAIV